MPWKSGTMGRVRNVQGFWHVLVLIVFAFRSQGAYIWRTCVAEPPDTNNITWLWERRTLSDSISLVGSHGLLDPFVGYWPSTEYWVSQVVEYRLPPLVQCSFPYTNVILWTKFQKFTKPSEFRENRLFRWKFRLNSTAWRLESKPCPYPQKERNKAT